MHAPITKSLMNETVITPRNPCETSWDSCRRHFQQEFALVILRAKSRFKSAMSEWLEALF
jgi:hypothetical protein